MTPRQRGSGRHLVRRALTVLVCLVPLVGGCATTVDGRPLSGRDDLVRPTATAGTSAIQWGTCVAVSANGSAGGGDQEVPDGAECGTLTVPVDYAKPDGPSAHLALIRFAATGPRIGSLVINPGGPGESGVDDAVALRDSLPAEVRQRFDLVGFDPRGVGSSTPALRCDSDADDDAQRADPQVDYSPAGVAHIEATEKQFVQRCVAKMGKDFLANVGTATVVKDLDAIRAGLGDAKLTYLGYSYGTLIGSAYAEAYPGKVRAMILDGAVDPDVDPVQQNVNQAAGFQKAFDDYAAACAQKPGCPLGSDSAMAVEVYHHLVDPLVGRPAATKDPRGLGYSDATTGTIMAMYSPNLWERLTKGLAELAGGHGDTLLSLADDYWDRDPNGNYSNANDAMVAINCVDQPAVTDHATVVDADRRVRAAAPFSNYGQATGDAPLSTCAFWPVPATSTPHTVSAPGLPPVLVVSTTHDPATPYRSGVDLARQLHANLLTYRGTQHTVVFEGNDCVDKAATAYLVDLASPADATC